MTYSNIKTAFEAILNKERHELLTSDIFRTPLICCERGPFGIPIQVPIDHEDYSFSAFFNKAESSQYILSRLRSQRFSLKPNLKGRKYLFRGQSNFYPSCTPSIYRTGKNEDTNYLIEECALGQELMLLMLSHPLVQLLDFGFPLGRLYFRIEMNLFGLTQHYYNKTNLLDFTSDPLVAAFFATSDYDPQTDTYSPVLDENRSGVLYFYNLNPETSFKTDNLRSIGLQVFPRSGAQKGFLLEMSKDEDLNKYSNVEYVTFNHNAELSQKIFDMMLGGKLLFPDDILARHWNTYNKNQKFVSKSAMVLNSIINSHEKYSLLVDAIKEYGYEIKNYKPSFNPEELTEYYQDVKNGFWEEFCTKIYLPADKNGKLREQLLRVESSNDYKWAFSPNVSHLINFKEGFLQNMYEKALIA